jgi:cell wall-associated NlpC family hydrolase
LRIARTTSRVLLLGVAAVGILAPSSVAQAAPTVAQIQQQINQSSASMEQIVEQYDKITEQLTASQAAEADLLQKMAPLQGNLDDATASIDKLASLAYMSGPASTANALLDAGSPQALLDRLGSLDELGRRQKAAITTYQQAKSQFDDQKKLLDANLAAQKAQQDTLAAQKTKIDSDLKALYALRTQAYGTPTQTAYKSTAVAPYVPGAAGIAVKYAYGAIGKLYHFASAGPDEYDCSGLTMAAWAAAGVQLPHNAAEQYNDSAHVSHVSRSQLQPGDLVFYNSLGHVAIYVGNNQVIHAPQPGETVQVASVDMMPPYGYGRPHN